MIRVALILAVAITNQTLFAAEPAPPEIRQFIAECRQETAKRAAKLEAMSREWPADAEFDEAIATREELADIRTGKLIVPWLPKPPKRGIIRTCEPNRQGVVAERDGGDLLCDVRELHLFYPSPQRSERKLVRVRFKNCAQFASESFPLPAAVRVVSVGKDELVLEPFDLKAAEKYLPARNWFVTRPAAK